MTKIVREGVKPRHAGLRWQSVGVQGPHNAHTDTHAEYTDTSIYTNTDGHKQRLGETDSQRNPSLSSTGHSKV